jgi:hypothetical protein
MLTIGLISALTAFVCGVIYDVVNVFFMHHVERGHAIRASGFSMFVGSAAVTGFLEAAHNPAAKWWLIAGYGVGTYLAVKWTNRKKAAQST